MQLLTYNQMIERTRNFYKELQIAIPDKYIELAVRSLTMPQYAYVYSDKKIGDHMALATVGDAVCGAFIMLDEYDDSKTKEGLTAEKDAVTNKHLNAVGEKLLKDRLFAHNNDLSTENTKAYATAFEAVIGFIALLDKIESTTNTNRILKEQLNSSL